MIKLIEDWRKAWKFASVQINVLGLLVMAIDFAGQTWNSLPPFIHEKIPNASTVAMVLFGLGILGRIVKLREKPNGESKD